MLGDDMTIRRRHERQNACDVHGDQMLVVRHFLRVAQNAVEAVQGVLNMRAGEHDARLVIEIAGVTGAAAAAEVKPQKICLAITVILVRGAAVEQDNLSGVGGGIASVCLNDQLAGADIHEQKLL